MEEQYEFEQNCEGEALAELEAIEEEALATEESDEYDSETRHLV